MPGNMQIPHFRGLEFTLGVRHEKMNHFTSL